MGNYKDIKKGSSLPITYQMTIFFIQLGSLYILILLLSQRANIDSYLIIFGIAILFLININIFYLYDVLNRHFEEKLEALFLEGQNKYYKNQIETMQDNENNIQSLQHNLKSHLQVLNSYITKDKNRKALEYIRNLNQEFHIKGEISCCGNLDIDSILNYKLKQAISKDIKVSLKNDIPSNINISSIDIVSILGNLIDNAIETTSKLKSNRKINIKMKLEKEVFFISVNYNYNDNFTSENEDIVASKIDKKDYEMEFGDIEKIVKKYNGMIIMKSDEMESNVDILMYIN